MARITMGLKSVEDMSLEDYELALLSSGFEPDPDTEPEDNVLDDIVLIDVKDLPQQLTIDEWLDREDLDRLELDRLVRDLYPGIPKEGSTSRVHTDRDAIQGWLAKERNV